MTETEDEFEPLTGRYSYKQLRLLPASTQRAPTSTMEQLKYELDSRNLTTIGYRTQLAGRLYQAFVDEGRGLTGAESAEVDHALESIGESAEEEAMAAAILEHPLLAIQRSLTGKLIQDDPESVLSNKSGMQTTFMSTQTAPNGIRAATAAALRTLQSVWLFDCGEDTQRSLLGHPLVDWKRIDRVFVTSMTPEAVLGLPGMLCTVSASRERGHEFADIPVHVFGPPGLVQFVASMLSVSRTYLEMPVILHEFTPRAVPADQLQRPVEVLRRSRLYALPLPPDQLNPDGYYDGELQTMLNRHKRKRTGGGADLRAGTLEQQLPPPGDANRTGVAVGDMTWTVRIDSGWTVTAAPVKNGVPTLGYVIQESDRAGRLYPDVARALGVGGSEQFAMLKEGYPVAANDDSGRMVRPEQCVGPPRPGRRMAFVPPCVDSSGFAQAMKSADVVVHSMVPPPGSADAVAAAGGAPAMAGRCAAAMGADDLVLWQPLTSFLDGPDAVDEEFPVRAVEEARDTFGKEYVSMAGSFRVHEWDRNEGDRVPTELPEELRHLVESKLDT